jgi:hypothetical protein
MRLYYYFSSSDAAFQDYPRVYSLGRRYFIVVGAIPVICSVRQGSSVFRLVRNLHLSHVLLPVLNNTETCDLIVERRGRSELALFFCQPEHFEPPCGTLSRRAVPLSFGEHSLARQPASFQHYFSSTRSSHHKDLGAGL